MDKKKNIKVIAGILILACIITVAISFAILKTTLHGKKNVILTVGDIDVSIADDSTNVISVSNGIPVADSVGQASSPYKFTIKNNGSKSVKADIYLDDDSDQRQTCITSNGTCDLITNSMISYQLITPSATTSSILSSNRKIGTVTIAAKGSSNCELRVWMNMNADDSAKGKYFFGKINLDVTEITK